MNPIEEKLNSIAKKTFMTTEEKSRIRARLQVEMAMARQARFAPRQTIWMYIFRRHSFSMSLAIMLFFGTGVSVLAEKALPGDVLYPLKTGVNEQILGWFASTPYKEAELSVRLANRRLSEAENLATRNDKPSDIKKQHNLVLEEQIEEADSYVRQLSGVNKETSASARNNYAKKTIVESPDMATMSLMAPGAESEDPNSLQMSGQFVADPALEDDSVSREVKEMILNLKKRIKALKTGEYRDVALLAEVGLVQIQKALLLGTNDASEVTRQIEELNMDISAMEENKLNINNTVSSEATIILPISSENSTQDKSEGENSGENDSAGVDDLLERGL